MTALERLLAEAVPDGTFGGCRPAATPRPVPAARRTSPTDAARHRADLLAALTRKASR